MNKNKLKALIAALEYLRIHKILYDQKGMELTGMYWDDIKLRIRDRCAGNLSRGSNIEPHKRDGCVSILFVGQVDAYLAECKDELERIEKEEYDRDLDNKSKKAAIKANLISKWAIAISVLAATGLPQYLLKWLYEIIVKIVRSLAG